MQERRAEQPGTGAVPSPAKPGSRPAVALFQRAGRRHRAGRRQWVVVAAVGVGGIVGALARYLVFLAFPSPANQIPWATVGINLSGSFVLGFLLVLLAEQFPRGRLARPLIGTGVIGAYTTFSTFMIEAVQLARAGRPLQAAVYVAISLVGGLAAVAVGMVGARSSVRAERWLQEER